VRSGRSLPTRDDKDGIMTGLRAVSGLFTFWVLAMNPGKKLRVAFILLGQKRTSEEKAHTSLLRLAVANVRRKAVLRVKSAIELSLIGSKGGFMRYLNTTMRSQLGISR
jgi:hypothetical protein